MVAGEKKNARTLLGENHLPRERNFHHLSKTFVGLIAGNRGEVLVDEIRISPPPWMGLLKHKESTSFQQFGKEKTAWPTRFFSCISPSGEY